MCPGEADREKSRRAKVKVTGQAGSARQPPREVFAFTGKARTWVKGGNR